MIIFINYVLITLINSSKPTHKEEILLNNDKEKDAAKLAVKNFLLSQIDKKTEKEQKQLEKAKEKNDINAIAELNAKIAEVTEKFNAKDWLEHAATKMSKSLKFGTHISKGIHPAAKGDNIRFNLKKDRLKQLPIYFVGTHSINSQFIDANGDAAALPLASFFDFPISETQKIKDLILEDNIDFIQSLSDDIEQAKSYHQAFKRALLNVIETPVSHERNKQMLWPENPYSAEHLSDLDYTTIVPLYPSVLTFDVYQKFECLYFSKENEQACKNHFENKTPQQPYINIPDLATIKLGGTKAQNVGKLNNLQSGKHYLLPSMPPPPLARKGSRIENMLPSKNEKTLFNSKLQYHCKRDLEQFFKLIKDNRNNVDLRNKRKEVIDSILHTLFSLADYIRSQFPAGWSKNSEFEINQRYWLDPMRSKLEGEEDFALKRSQEAWITDIMDNFANWMNQILKAQFPKLKANIAEAEHLEWKREIEEHKKYYERIGKGVFL